MFIRGSNPAAASRTLPVWLIPALLIAAYVAQCLWFISTQSLTFDEPHHIKAGLAMWRDGRFEYSDGHPSLPRLWMALPLIAREFQIGQIEENTATGFRPSPEAIAWRGRLMQVLLGVALAVLVWCAARQFYSTGAANLALAFFAFSPALITHFSVATTDAAGVLMTFAAPLAVLRWRRAAQSGVTRRTLWCETLLLGVVLALLLLAKFYTQTLFVLALLWVLIAKRGAEGKTAGAVPSPCAATESERRPLRWNWGVVAALCGMCFALVWAAYAFHVTRITLEPSRQVRLEIPGYPQPVVEKTPFAWSGTLYLPALEYLAGFGAALDHNRRGHSSYFFGEISSTGWKLYFPAMFVLKWPTLVLLLVLIGVTLVARRGYPWPPDALIFHSFPVLFLLPVLMSKINIGDRHILPVYPFALVFVAGLWEMARRSQRRKLWCALLAVAALLTAADSLRVAPDYLSWFNIFIEPQETWRIVADSSVDWGQGLLALRDYQRQHPGDTIYLAYSGNVAPEVYGIRYTPLAAGQRVSGTVVASTVMLAGRGLRDPNAYKWLLQHQRVALLNHSLHVFRIE